MSKLSCAVSIIIFYITQSESTMKISWRRCTDSPVTNAIPPTVKIGDSVYVGCKLRNRGDDVTIFKYSLTHDTWSPLPDCPTIHHGLATLDDELIVIGGMISGKQTILSGMTYGSKFFQQCRHQEINFKQKLSKTR